MMDPEDLREPELGQGQGWEGRMWAIRGREGCMWLISRGTVRIVSDLWACGLYSGAWLPAEHKVVEVDAE